MEFKTYYGEKEEFRSNPGEKYKILYQLQIDEKGNHELVPCGQTDINAEIASHEPSVNIMNIISRYMKGEEGILERAEGFYADVSKLPVKLLDVMNLNLKGKQFFDDLPIDLKQLYGQDYEKFMLDPGKLVDYLKEQQKKSRGEVEPEIGNVKPEVGDVDEQ